MSIQRIVQLTAYDGSLHHFSDQPFAEGKSYRFPTAAVAAQFVERFKLSNLADIEEIARWLGVQPTVGVYREKCTFADYVTPLSDALTNNRLHVVQIASVNAAGVKPSAPVPAPKVQAAKPAADGKSAQQESQSSVSQEPQAESSRNHETAGDPVSMVTGEEILTLCDVANHPVLFSRTYRSSRCDSDSGIGFGWRHSFDLQLFDVQAEDGEVSHWQFVDEMGDTILFPAVNQGAVSYQAYVGASCFYQNDKYRLVTLKNGVQYKFEHVDEHWLLRQIRPSVLQRVELNYSLKHRLIGVSTNQHPSLEFQYDQRGHLIEVREPHSGRVLAQYRYDPQDCLIAATNQQAQTEQYAYSQSHLIIRRQRCTGFTHYFEWVGEGSAAKCVRNYGDDQTYDYCFAYQDDRSSFRDTLGNQWLFLHSAQGKLLEKHSPEGRKWRWDYDHLGRVVAEHFPDGSCVSFQYNQYGQKIAQQHTSGATTRYQYNQLGQQTMLLHPDGEKQYQHYNSLGQLLWRSATDGTVTEYQYDKFGRLIQSHSARGEKQQWWWNDIQQLVARQINQTLLRYSYDQHNDLDGIAYPDEMVVAFERDSHGQVVKTKAFNSKDDTQREVSYQYDDFGRLTQITTPAGRSVIEWGKLAQPEAIIRTDGSALAFEYDGERNLTAITRSDGVQYHLTLSADGHLAQITNFDGICTQYDYDAAGRLAHLRCAERQVAFDYDLNGNLCLVRAGGEYGLCENHFQFSAGSKLRLASNAKRTIQNLYQSDGLLSEQTQGNHTFVYRYNACGQLAEIELPDGETMILAYTAYGQLQRVQRKECQTEAVQYEYDEMGRICRLYCGGQSEERQFDGIGRLNLQRWPEKTRKYHYDAAQHLAIVIDSESGATHYQYDALGQLTRAKSVYVEEKYHFDGFGHPQGQASQRLGDRLLEHQGWRFQYDAHGNQIKAEGQGQEQSRRFNALNQLVEVQCDDQLAYYEYDALGRRSRKVTEAGVTEFLWQDSQLIGEYHQGRYRWYFYQPESHIPSMLVQDGQCYFYQCDHLGTPLRLVTSQGEIVWQAHYETWGTAHIEIEQVTNPLRFQGQYYDAETGLHYNLARYYDPRTGRFIQPDPIGLLGGLNHYQYAPNPVMWVDRYGLLCQEGQATLSDMLSTLVGNGLSEENKQKILQAAIASAPQLDDVKAYVKHKIKNGENLIQYGYDVDTMNPAAKTITISREHGEKVIEKTMSVEQFAGGHVFDGQIVKEEWATNGTIHTEELALVKARYKGEAQVVELTEAQKRELQVHLDERARAIAERDKHAKGSDAYNKQIPKINEQSAKIGEKAADMHVQNAYPGAKRLHPKDLDHSSSVSGNFDMVYQLPDGGVVIVEAKGGSSALGKKKIDKSYYQQGTTKYAAAINQNMLESPDADQVDAALAIQKSAKKGKPVHYLHISTPIDNDSGLSSVSVKEFDIDASQLAG
ncbi:RHS repeat protein [Vibrio navarrensis]|nr:RHS repeat protein [Vibrio navarrensis]